METLGYILIALTAVHLWTENIFPKILMKPLFSEAMPTVYHYRTDFTKWLDRKPLNCGTCLCFWLGLIMFLFTNDLFLLSLPLYYKLTSKL